MFGVTKVGNDINSRQIREFVADSVNDINKLPCRNYRGTQSIIENDPIDDYVSPGSTCFVIEDSSVWMLGNDDSWHEI